ASYFNRGIISVAAVDYYDVLAPFSNRGILNTHIGAPGVNILSTLPSGTCRLCRFSGYDKLSGTSMAAPHVTGIVAALFQRNPNLTPFQVRDIVLDSESYDASGTLTNTGGRVNFAKALANPKLLAPPALNNFPAI